MYIHLTIVAHIFLLESVPTARHAWRVLRAAFPGALAACLMGNHIHILLWSDDPDADRVRLGCVASGIARFAGVDGAAWKPAARPEFIVGVRKLAQQVRYIVLNPCRAEVASDPLLWPWSTHRDVVGAVADPWITADRLARHLGEAAIGFAAAHHRFVSNDSWVTIGGTPFPMPAPRRVTPTVPLSLIAAAACSGTRAPSTALRIRGVTRRLFVQLAAEQGWTSPRFVGPLCGAAANTTWRLMQDPNVALLRAGRLCLGDTRLRTGIDTGAAPVVTEPVFATPE